MKVTILTVGTRGDVQPYVALGRGLQQAGFTVCLAAHPPFADFVRAYGLEFRPIAGDPRLLLQSTSGQAWLDTGWNPVPFVRHLFSLVKPIVSQILKDLWLACQDADLVLFPILLTFAALSIAEKLAIPAYPTYLQPAHRTADFPNVMIAPNPRLGRLYHLFSHFAAEQIFWQLARPALNGWRRDSLDLPPYPLVGFFKQFYGPDKLFLYGYSPLVVPKPPTWPDRACVAGYWFLEPATDWQPPAALHDFLEAGPAPVYIGFGSMPDRNAAEITDIALKALLKTKQRGLLLTGWGGLSNADLPDHIFKIEAAPHDWLFPKMAAVVHHGGAGTTAAGLRAGVPSLVVPFFADQYFWGWRVAELGVGPAALPRRHLSAERLAQAIKATITHRAYQTQAAALGQKLRAEDGVGRAVAALSRELA